MYSRENYESLNWKEIPYPNMVRIKTIPDGSCFFHALCNAFFIPYRTGKITCDDGSEISITQRQIVKGLRDDLAKKLASRIDANPESPRYYDVISRGQLGDFSMGVNHYSLENMQKELQSDDPIDHIYNEFISDLINKDIYLLDLEKEDVYVTGNDIDILYKNRESIVILSMPGHYELVGVRDNGTIKTLFKPDHEFIVMIYNRLKTHLPNSDLPNSDLPTSDLPVQDLPVQDLQTFDLEGS